MLIWLQCIGSIWNSNLTRGMQVVVSLDSTEVTGVVGIPFQIFTILVRKCLYVLGMCCLNKTITTLNQSVMIAPLLNLLSRIYFIFGLFVLWPVYNNVYALKRPISAITYILHVLINRGHYREISDQGLDVHIYCKYSFTCTLSIFVVVFAHSLLALTHISKKLSSQEKIF